MKGFSQFEFNCILTVIANCQGRPGGGGGVVENQYTRKKNDKIPQNTPKSSKYTQK